MNAADDLRTPDDDRRRRRIRLGATLATLSGIAALVAVYAAAGPSSREGTLVVGPSAATADSTAPESTAAGTTEAGTVESAAPSTSEPTTDAVTTPPPASTTTQADSVQAPAPSSTRPPASGPPTAPTAAPPATSPPTTRPACNPLIADVSTLGMLDFVGLTPQQATEKYLPWVQYGTCVGGPSVMISFPHAADTCTSDPALYGKIYAQSPAPGSPVTYGINTVAISVYRNPYTDPNYATNCPPA